MSIFLKKSRIVYLIISSYFRPTARRSCFVGVYNSLYVGVSTVYTNNMNIAFIFFLGTLITLHYITFALFNTNNDSAARKSKPPLPSTSSLVVLTTTSGTFWIMLKIYIYIMVLSVLVSILNPNHMYLPLLLTVYCNTM